MIPRVVRVPPSTGIRGKLFNWLSTSYLLPATATRTATTRAHSQTARACFVPLKRAIRPATYPQQ
jgi:hypothetical protein